MDTLHVFNQQTSGSRHSSRTPSPSRYAQAEQMSRDRESSDSSAVAASGTVNPGTNIRYRNQSPSARRSRERERSDKDQSKEIIIAQSTLNSSDMTADHMDAFDDSRVSGDDMIGGYPSFGSDELEYGDMDNRQLLLLQQYQQQQSTPQNRHHRTNSLQAIDRLTTKIACTKESIRREQTARDDNVNEYLKLAASADKQQLSRIKAVFEKKNQKSAHNISQLQKKLESYNKRYKDLQIQQNLKLQQQIQQQKDHRKPGEVLRDVGQGLRNVGGNIRDGVTGLSATVMSKPREFAHLLKNKFGSADNINQLSSTWYTDPDLQELNLQTEGHTTGSGGHGHAHVHSSNNLGGGGGSSGKFNSEHDSECSSVTSDSNPGGLFLKCKNTGSGSGGVGGGAGSGDKIASQQQQCPISIKSLLAEIQERKEDCDKLKERIERLESNQKEFESLTSAFESERFRAENLIEQMNDMQELHQTEIENLKQAMADMEEKVQYQSDERLRDINEVLENCQTRISKMEHMSQQIVTVEGIDNSNARALIVKLINVVLTVLQVILLLVATGAGILMPFLKTRVRVLTTFFFVLLIIFIFRSWPDFRDIGSHMVKRLRDVLVK